MTLLEAALRQINADLTQAHVCFALIGGLAVSARTEPRFTRDADFAVAVTSDAEAEALIRALRAQGYGIQAIVEQDAVERHADLVDLRALLSVASPGEVARARDSLALIAQRGYHRGRDLMSEINTLLPPAR